MRKRQATQTPQRPNAAVVLLVLMLAATVLLPGCRHNFANENDTLRARVVDLESQVDQLNRRNAELEAQVRSDAGAPTTLPEDIRLNTPHVAELAIDKLSFARDTNKDGRADLLTVYLKPADGLGRFVQMVGSINVVAAIVPVKGEPVSIGRKSFTPSEVREAYRSGITGTHYTIEVPINVASEFNDESCLVKVEFHDGLTGRTMTAERTISLK